MVFVIILLYSSFATYVSEYSLLNRLKNSIDLTLIEAENMDVEYLVYEADGINMISIEPARNTDQFIYDLLELNLIGNGLDSYQITGASIDQTDFISSQDTIHRVPVVKVTIEDRQQGLIRDKIHALRIIHPDDLPEN